jgi:hypothetical protein
MEPLNRNKRILLMAVAGIFALVMVGSFFLPLLKDFYQARQNGKNASSVPLLIFGGFFLVMIVTMVASMVRGLRQLQNPVAAAAPRAAAPSGGAGVFLCFFAVIWTGMVLMFDGFMGHGIYKQLESRAYPSVTGAITHSEVTSHRGSKGGTSYTAVIEYSYEVGDRKFAGNKIRFGLASSSYASATAIVFAHPLGAAVPVFYNPANPQEALLSPGVQGSDFMGLLFMTPFNMVMLGLWLWVGGWLREHLFKPVAGGVKIITDVMVTRIRLPQFPAAGWGLAATGGLGFIAVFIVGFGTNMEPSMPVVLSVLAAVYGAGLGVYLWQRQKINSGIDDLLINEASRTLELPLTFGRKARITANVTDIACLSVERIEHRSSKGGISYTYAPTLQLRGAEPGTQKIADWSDQLKADEFTGWLRDRLGASIPAEYVAPVSQTNDETAGDQMDGDPSDAPRSAPVEIPRPEHSKIQVTDGPRGREFYFPASRNLGTAAGLTAFFLVWSGIFYALLHSSAPVLFPIVWGVSDAFIGWACFNLWFKSSRVTINSTNVQWTKRWLIFSRTRDFPASDYARFAMKTGMQSGSTIFNDIKLVRVGADAAFTEKMKKFEGGQPVNQLVAERFRQAAGPAGVTVANSIASAAEAEWLVREMNKALGRMA